MGKIVSGGIKRLRAPSAAVERWLTLSKQVIEIVALCVGGWWAYAKFIRTEAPAQQRNFVSEQRMEWADSPQPSVCYAMLGITLQNVSRSEVHISKVMQRAWLLPLPRFDRPIAYVDPDSLAKARPADSVSYTSGSFIQDYPPLAKVQYDLVWTLRRTPGIALFRIDLFADSTDAEPTDWVYDWDEICGGVDSVISEKSTVNSVKTKIH